MGFEAQLLSQILSGSPLLATILLGWLLYRRDQKHSVTNEQIHETLCKVVGMAKSNHDMLDWLKNVHDAKDADGVYKWYIRQSLEDTIKGLSAAVESLASHIKDVHRESQHTVKALEKMVERLERE